MGILNPVVHILSSEIFSPLGLTLEATISAMENGNTSLLLRNDETISPEPFCASAFDDGVLRERFSLLGNPDDYTRFEMMSIISADGALKKAEVDPSDPDFLLIISTTKGNIELRNSTHSFSSHRIQLHEAARQIGAYFKTAKPPVVVSNACISGVLSLIAGFRAIRHGEASTVAVVGADTLNPFIVSGFQSFKSLSLQPARPYDSARDGLTLGEASATIILSKDAPQTGESIVIAGGAIANDANHISGPSRTGQGLYTAVNSAFSEAGLQSSEIDMISAHGTATLYNDEMESIAFSRCGLSGTPLHSLKGYFGHTLGAAGVIESAILIENMRRGRALKTRGYETNGVSDDINIITENVDLSFQTTLKTASGFGGTNSAIVFRKEPK